MCAQAHKKLTLSMFIVFFISKRKKKTKHVPRVSLVLLIFKIKNIFQKYEPNKN